MTIYSLKKISTALLSTMDYIVNCTSDEDGNSAILSIINTISEKNKKQTEIILTAFSEAVEQKIN